MEFNEDVQELDQQGFVIDNDSKAEWALKKIKEAYDEHDRLMALVVEQEVLLERKEKALDEKLEKDTNYLKHLLNQYMDDVKCKETKTQKSYQLLTGKLVRKQGTVAFEKDEDALLEWTKQNRPNLIKIKASVDWAELKKELTINGEEIITADGEILECVKAEQKPDSFDIKW